MGSIPGQKDPLEKGMATHSSMLACKIPCTGEPGRLQSMEYHKESDITEHTPTQIQCRVIKGVIFMFGVGCDSAEESSFYFHLSFLNMHFL